jgi:amino acid transporter
MADLSAGARLKTNVVTLPGVLILFALFNSAIAVSIACMNASARFLYGMSRAKALPGSLTKVHPVYATPTNAIITQTGINVVLGLLLPLIIGVANVYNVTGTWFTFALAFVYVMASIGLYRFYRYQHAVIPFIGSAALIVVVYYSVNPLPAWPVSLAPFIVLGWLVVGFGVLAYVYRGDRARNLALAGLAMGETPETVAGAVSDSGQVPAPGLGSLWPT